MVVLDSSFLVAHHNQRDAHHVQARQVMDRLLAGEWGSALLLEYVFVEVVTVLLVRRDLHTAARVATILLQAAEVVFVPCSDIFPEALEVFKTQARGALSFTDAAIVTLARNRGASVVTFDRDFREVNGISIIPT